MSSPEVNEAEGRGAPRCASPGCRTPVHLLRYDQSTDLHWCRAHDPSPEVQAMRRSDQERGGMSTARRFKRGLDESELGPLESATDAMRWSRVIATAVATGALIPSAANAALRAVTSFTQARDLMTRESRLADLEAELARLRSVRRVQ